MRHFDGHERRALTTPLWTRCFASWQARSARPTIEKAGRSAPTRCASTSTRRGSRPTTAEVTARASTPPTLRAIHARETDDSEPRVCRAPGSQAEAWHRLAGSAGDGHENRLVVLAAATAGAPVHVPLVACRELQSRPAQNLGIEAAPVVHHDADPAPGHERAPRVREHLGDAVHVLLDRRPTRAAGGASELEVAMLVDA